MSDTANKIAVMQAFAEGKRIERRVISDGDKPWRAAEEPGWNWIDFDYRIAPHPPEPRSAREWQAGVSTLTGRIYTWGDDMLSGKERFEKITVREVLPEPPQADEVPTKELIPRLVETIGEPPQAQADGPRIFRRHDGYQWVAHKDGRITWHWRDKSGLCAFPVQDLINDLTIYETTADGTPLS